MRERSVVCLILLLFCRVVGCRSDTSLKSVANPFDYSHYHTHHHENMFKRALDGLGTLIVEAPRTAITVNLNLISWETFSLAAGTLPFFIAARMVDERLQNCFYERQGHKNCFQLPSWLKPCVEQGIGIPMTILMSYALFCRSEDDRKMGRIFATIMPFVIFGKDLIKRLKFDFCQRPWNEKFSCEKRAHGGFPSGHMAEAVYMASFFGMHYGPSHAVPLGIFAAALGITFINCNRHYLSQIVAGSVWGVMFAVASNKLMEPYKRTGNMTFGVGIDDAGSPAVGMHYRF